jgi:hypothetical protein
MKLVTFLIGVAMSLLGALWFLQGAGIVHLRAILCFADCAPVQEPSLGWLAIGGVMLVMGLVVMQRARRMPPPVP